METAIDPIVMVENLLDHLQATKGASAHTIAAYRGDLVFALSCFDALGMVDWRDLSEAMILKFEATLAPPVAPRTAQRRLSALRSMVKYLNTSHGARIEMPEVRQYRTPRPVPKALPLEKVLALLGAPDLATQSGLRDRALMELLYGCGLRISEAVELPVAALDWNVAAIQVTGKREKTRWVPIPKGCMGPLESYWRDGRPALTKRPLDRFIVSNRGLAMRRTTAAHALAVHARSVGIAHATPHMLRHSYAVHLLTGGAGLRAVQELLGHESIATTQVYTQLDLDEVRRNYDTAHPRK